MKGQEMLKLGVKHNLLKIAADLEKNYSKQVKFATAKTLTDVAGKVRVKVAEEMSRKFDKPKPETLKSLVIKPASKNADNPQAEVFVKDRPFAKNPLSLAEILEHQFSGGTRRRKRIEKLFERKGLISSNDFLVPGEGAKLDQYGNMSLGEVSKILANLGANLDAIQNSTRRSRVKARDDKKRSAAGYFWSNGQRLPKGVWLRYRFGYGNAVKPIMIVINAPKYSKRIDMAKIASEVISKDLDRLLAENLRAALKSSR
jgi:hypothetical protein